MWPDAIENIILFLIEILQAVSQMLCNLYELAPYIILVCVIENVVLLFLCLHCCLAKLFIQERLHTF